MPPHLCEVSSKVCTLFSYKFFSVQTCVHLSICKDEVSFVRHIQARGSFGGLLALPMPLWGVLDSDSLAIFQLINKCLLPNSIIFPPSKICFSVYREADESRLREVCESFLGPPTGMAEAGSSDTNLSWDPYVLVSIQSLTFSKSKYSKTSFLICRG